MRYLLLLLFIPILLLSQNSNDYIGGDIGGGSGSGNADTLLKTSGSYPSTGTYGLILDDGVIDTASLTESQAASRVIDWPVDNTFDFTYQHTLVNLYKLPSDIAYSVDTANQIKTAKIQLKVMSNTGGDTLTPPSNITLREADYMVKGDSIINYIELSNWDGFIKQTLIDTIDGATSTAVIPTDSLFAYYAYSGNTNDGSGNGYNLTNNGGVLAMDRYLNSATAYRFDGTADYQQTVATPQRPGNGVSVSAWVFLDVLNGGPNNVIDQRQGGNQYEVRVFDSIVEFTVYDAAQAQITILRDTLDQIDTWYYICGTTAGDNGDDINLYVGEFGQDNLELKDTDVLTADVRSATGSITTARRGHTTSSYFEGKLDDLRIYYLNRLITFGEANALYKE